ncbi:MAG: NAD(P)-binding protein [Polyangiaceae bacterium]|jgi:NADPH-dependent glutamate synthase beta subunit-like oxidoreductase
MNKPFAITLDSASSRANHTGAWRVRRPVYVERLSPCDHACPAGELPQEWLAHAEQGDYRAAWEAVVRHNPIPAVMGRACYHPCETACNRARLDAAVSIHAVERFLGDLAIRERWRLPDPGRSTGKRILVIGGGPSGLSAAYHLALAGHAVSLREAAPALGGMMRYGIPRYRLPRDILDAEIARVVDMGLRVETGARVSDAARAKAEGGFDACFVAIGAHLANRVEIPASDATRILEATALLHGMEESGERPRIGRRVIVYGGGNTAIDVARTVKRLGAEEAWIVYRRTRAQMPAHDFEVREAMAEGVQMRWLSTIQRAQPGHIVVERMELDPSGKACPTGELETLDADTVVLAIGQNVDLSAIEKAPGVRVVDRVVEVNAQMMTGHPGLFAGGDMVPCERTIAVAVGHGEKAARNIDAWMRAATCESVPEPSLADFESLNPWYYGEADPAVQPTLEALRRRTTFEEVHGGLDEEHALLEARRCMSCGHCFECDNCYGMCPDNAIVKLGPGRGFHIDLDYCKGCGICSSECPCGAIAMVDEGA